MNELAYDICGIAQRAGGRILEIRSNFEEDELRVKGDGSPVTQADLAAHDLIVRDLSTVRQGWPIVSEEGSVGGSPSLAEFSFLVDPLDGTKEFIRGNGMYTVNIAVMSRNSNGRWSPILGVVHAPEYKSTWFGGKFVKATLLDPNGMNFISAGSDRPTPIILGSVSHSSPRDRKFSEAIGEHIFEGVGSSLKICRVADGSADLAPRFGPTSCWDTAAAHAVLNSAGGNLLNPDGNELDYDIERDILNPWFLATSGGRSKDIWLAHQEG